MISKSTQTLPTQKVGLYDLSQDFRNVIKTPPQEFIDLKIEIGFLNHEASGIYKLMPYYQRVLPKDSGIVPHIIQKNPLDGTWEMKKIYDSKNQEIIHSFPKEIENPLRDSIVVNVFESLKKEAQKMKKESENLKKEVKSKNENMESLKKEVEFLQTLNAENVEANRKEFENKLLEKENQIKDINGKFQKKYKNLKFEQNQTFEAKQKLIENKHIVEKKDLKKKHEEKIQVMQEKFEQKLLEKDNEISNFQIQFTKFQKLNENLETENSSLKYKQTILEENSHSCHSLYKKVENELTNLKKKTKKKVDPMKNKPTELFYDCQSDSLLNSESMFIKKLQHELHEKDNQLYNLKKEIVRWSHNNTIEYKKLHTLHTKMEQNLEEESKMWRKSVQILKEEIQILKEFQAKNLNESKFEPDSDILTSLDRIVNQNHEIKLLEKEHELKLLEKDSQLKLEHNIKEKAKILNEFPFQYKTIDTSWNENKFETTELDSDILKTNGESIIKQEYQLKLFEKETQLKMMKNELIEFNQKHIFEYEMLHAEHLKVEKDLQEENRILKITIHKLKETIKNFRIMIKNVAEDKLQNTALKLDMKKGFLNILCEKDNQIINLQKSNKDLLSDCAKLKNLRTTQNISSNDEEGCKNMIIEFEKMHEQENHITNLQSQLAEFQSLNINFESENVTLKSKEEDSINAESISSNDVEKVIIEINKMHEKEIQIKDLQSQLAECQKLSNNLFSKHVKFKSKEENVTKTESISPNVGEKIDKNAIIIGLEKKLVEKDTKIKHLESQLTECQNLESEKIKSNSNEKNVSCSCSSNVEKIEELEKKLFKKETNLNNLDLAFTTLDNIHKKVETQLKTENDKLKKLKKCNLPMQKKALISKIETKEEEILELQNKIYDLKIELTDIKKLNEDLKSENNNLMKSSSKTEIELKGNNISQEFIIGDISVKSLVHDVIAFMEYDYKNLVSYFINKLAGLDIHGNGYAELQAEIKSSLNLNELNRTSDMLDLDDKYTSVFVSHGVLLYVEETIHSIENLKFLETLNFDPKHDDEVEIIENWWISIGKPIYFDVLTTIDKKHKQIRDKALESFENSKLKAKYELFMKHNELFLDPKHEYENVLTDVGYIVHGVRQTMIEFKNSLYNYYSTKSRQTNKTY